MAKLSKEGSPVSAAAGRRMGLLRLRYELILVACLLSPTALGKDCTNSLPQSHTLRYQMWTTKNATWKAELLSHYAHGNPTESCPTGVDPSRDEHLDWATLYRSMRSSQGYPAVVGGFLREVSLHDVRLDPDSRIWLAQRTNLEYLLMLDVDRLVWSFRKQAGLSTPGRPYGGWEAPDMELRGHFVDSDSTVGLIVLCPTNERVPQSLRHLTNEAGALHERQCQMWASTHNDTLYQKMTAVVDALYACQKKMDSGYLSAFPTEFFDRVESLAYVWAPYYTIHKIMAGLLDQYSHAGNNQALQMVIWMAEYFGNRVKNVIAKHTIERHWSSLNEETGGMNELLYNLYSITGDEKHLILAHLFDKPCFLGLLAVQSDNLAGFHANTHIPVVIGAQRRYEVTGDPLYKKIGTYFMDIVNSSHSYATGGTSYGELWFDPKRVVETLQTENEESCTTYNMLKVSRNLFRWTKEMRYADYYEKAFINGVLSIQRGTEPGKMIYMLPLGVGVSKAKSTHSWGKSFDSFWCCYGTGIESFSKLGDSIYFEEGGSTPSIYIIQFISSSLNWKSGGIILNQNVKPVASSDPYLQVTLTISSNQSMSQPCKVNMRIPTWTSLNNAKAMLNGESLDIPLPGNFLSVTRKWTPNDKLTLQLPISLRTEAIQDDRPEYASVKAIFYGPYLLAGLTNGDWDISTGNSKSMSDWIAPVPSAYNSQLITLAQEFDDGLLVFSNSNNSITMEALPYDDGLDAAVHATFRVIAAVPASSGPQQVVMLEPLNLPGMVVAVRRPDGALVVSATAGADSTFQLAMGSDGKPNSVALESVGRPGCFVYGVGEANGPAGQKVRLGCHGGARRKEARFVVYGGMRAYNPIGFVAKGAKRNFLLEPLMSLKDETYTVYFNIGA